MTKKIIKITVGS